MRAAWLRDRADLAWLLSVCWVLLREGAQALQAFRAETIDCIQVDLFICKAALSVKILGRIGSVRLDIDSIGGAVKYLVEGEQATCDRDAHQFHGVLRLGFPASGAG